MIEIRLAKESEIAKLCEIFFVSRNTVGCYPIEDKSLDKFREIIKDEDLYVAISENKILGFVGIYPPDFIHHLYVLPEYQGRGIGKSLLDDIVKSYPLPITLKCDNCNDSAHKFYQGYGFLKNSEGSGDYGVWTEYAFKSR